MYVKEKKMFQKFFLFLTFFGSLVAINRKSFRQSARARRKLSPFFLRSFSSSRTTLYRIEQRRQKIVSELDRKMHLYLREKMMKKQKKIFLKSF